MKNLFALIALAVSLGTVNVRAESPDVTDGDRLQSCGGVVLTQVSDGRISLKFKNHVSPSCTSLSFYDYSSGKLIKQYTTDDLSGKTYTLSNDQMAAISSDCKINWKIQSWNGRVVENFVTTITGCRTNKRSTAPSVYPGWGVSFEWSNKGNCKLMQNGQFVRLVDKSYCH
jgi:hypothetical protein